MSNCELCGEPLPKGEEMFKYHGYSGPCPKQPAVGFEYLLPCPFCRATPQLIERGDREISYDIMCKTKDCYLEDGAEWHMSDKEELMKMWNNRV